MGPLPIQPERLLRHPSFALFWASRIFSALGFQVAAVAVGWLVYAKTGSAYALGLVGLFQFLPMVALTFLVGHVADRFDRRRIVAGCQFLECVLLALAAFWDRDGKLEVTALFAAVTVLGAARAFETPTMSALLPALVPDSLLQKAIAVSSSAMQTATSVGPSLGGLLYADGASVPLGVSALCLATAGGAMAFIKTERRPPKREPISSQSVFSGVGRLQTKNTMSPKRCRPLIAACPLIVIVLLQGCAQDTPPESGPIVDRPSNTTFSGYTRAGIAFPGR